MTLAAQLYVVVRGSDSIVEIPLVEDGTLVPSSGVTRCDLVFKRPGVADVAFSSSVTPTWFDLQSSDVIDGITLSIIRVNLGQIPTPPADGRYKVDVFIYDADFINGRLWGTLDFEVRPAKAVAAAP